MKDTAVRQAIAVALLLAASAPAAAQMAPPLPTTLSISAEAKVERAPDVADISAGVVTQGATASEAMRANATRMSAVIEALKRAGVADRDIQSSALNLQPQYKYQDNLPPVLVGYQASNTVSVEMRRIGDMGRIIDALVSAGSNQINGPTFRVDKPDAALDDARTAAFGKARARAELYARAAGMRVKRILSISEGGDVRPPYPPTPMYAMRAQAMDKATPVAPGEVELGATVNVMFELD